MTTSINLKDILSQYEDQTTRLSKLGQLTKLIELSLSPTEKIVRTVNRKEILILTDKHFINVYHEGEDSTLIKVSLDKFISVRRTIEDDNITVRLFFDLSAFDWTFSLNDKDPMAFFDKIEDVIADLTLKV